jgi:hypothetical protein
MIFEVELNAFMNGEIREVDVPDEVFFECITTEDVLDQVFRFGQNEVQPKDMCSVSMGDVIRIPHPLATFRFEVALFGFTQVKNLSRVEHDEKKRA